MYSEYLLGYFIRLIYIFPEHFQIDSLVVDLMAGLEVLFLVFGRIAHSLLPGAIRARAEFPEVCPNIGKL